MAFALFMAAVMTLAPAVMGHVIDPHKVYGFDKSRWHPETLMERSGQIDNFTTWML